jgi:hypothetical protein
MLEKEATPRRLVAFCRAQFEAWFDEAWDEATGVLLLSADEIDVENPVVRMARPPRDRARRGSLEAAQRRQLRDAEKEVRAVMNDVSKAATGVRRALSRLRSAANDARKLVTEWQGKLSIEDALTVNLDEVERLLEQLPEDLDNAHPPRRSEARTLVAERACLYFLDRFKRELVPRELVIIGILAGVAVAPRRGDTIAKVLDRERVIYAQTLMRLRQRRRASS